MLWAKSIGLQCKACSNSLAMSTVVCTDTVVKRALLFTTPHHINLKSSTKLERGNNIKCTFVSKDLSELYKIRANCINTYFHTTAAFFLHS